MIWWDSTPQPPLIVLAGRTVQCIALSLNVHPGGALPRAGQIELLFLPREETRCVRLLRQPQHALLQLPLCAQDLIAMRQRQKAHRTTHQDLSDCGIKFFGHPSSWQTGRVARAECRIAPHTHRLMISFVGFCAGMAPPVNKSV